MVSMLVTMVTGHNYGSHHQNNDDVTGARVSQELLKFKCFIKSDIKMLFNGYLFFKLEKYILLYFLWTFETY